MKALASTSHRAEVTHDQVGARVRLSDRRRRERRLTELRRTSARTPHGADTAQRGIAGPPPASRTRAWRSLSVLMLGATLTVAAIFIATTSPSGIPHHGLTPVARPASASIARADCPWLHQRYYGWYCSSTPDGAQYPLAEEALAGDR